MKIEGLENKTLEELIIIDKTSKKEFNENINFEKKYQIYKLYFIYSTLSIFILLIKMMDNKKT